jgi:nucleoside-diphosphate-sugar epimerase
VTYSRVLVTGAGGFIGRHVVRDQLQRGRQVRALDLRAEGLQALVADDRLQLVLGDVAEPEVQRESVDGIEVVFHLASAHLETGLPDSAYRQVNVTAVASLLEASRGAGVKRFVHVSSCGVHGSIGTEAADEEAPFRPTIAYERTKLEGELLASDYCRRTGFPVVVARPAWVYGPGCLRTARLFDTIARGKFVMIGRGRNVRSAIYVSDFVAGLELCARCPGAEGEAFIFVNDEKVTVGRIVDEVSRLAGRHSPRVRVPLWLGWGVATLAEVSARAFGRRPPITRRTLKFFTNDAGFTAAKASRILGFTPQVDLRSGLELTWRWWQEDGGGH